MLIPTKVMQWFAFAIGILVAVLKVIVPIVQNTTTWSLANVLILLLAVLVAVLPFVTVSDVNQAETKFRLKYGLKK